MWRHQKPAERPKKKKRIHEVVYLFWGVLFVFFLQTLTHVPLRQNTKKKTVVVIVVVVLVISNASCGCHGNLTRLLPPCRLLLLLLLSLLLLTLLTCFYASVCDAEAADTRAHSHAQCRLCEDRVEGLACPRPAGRADSSSAHRCYQFGWLRTYKLFLLSRMLRAAATYASRVEA